VTVKVSVGHELDTAAVESFKAWAFDVAAMIASFEGMAYTPALWIHDSPREGDLGNAIYQRYFEYAAQMEKPGHLAPFQYIITTTSEPPTSITDGDALVLRLDGNDNTQKLLRQPL